MKLNIKTFFVGLSVSLSLYSLKVKVCQDPKSIIDLNQFEGTIWAKHNTMEQTCQNDDFGLKGEKFLEKKTDKVCAEPPPVVVKDEAGHLKFYEYTDALADKAVELLNSGKKILQVFKTVVRKLSECESLS